MAHRRHHLPPRLTASQRRIRYTIRRVGLVVLAAVVLAGIYAGDHAGLFGTKPAPVTPDYTRYNERTFRVVYIVDGDTLDIDAPDSDRGTTRIRLWGVDTPETRNPRKSVQHFGPEASAYTRHQCQGQRVRLSLVRGKTRCKYGRLLAYVILPDGTMLNRDLVRLGYGYADPRYDHPLKREFLALQNEARKARLGLWKDARQKDLPYYLTDDPDD